jgi:glycerol-3-phosphate acyltransferase PlsY
MEKILFSFFIGSIPFGILVSKLFGVKNLRAVGSGNIGATNVVRAVGPLAGVLTFILDALKGFLPVFLFNEKHKLLYGLLSVLGHCYSPFLKFNGGKGVSTAIGAYLGYDFRLGLISGLSYILGLILTRISALGSLFSMIGVLIACAFFVHNHDDLLFIIMIVLIKLWRHKENWKKIFFSALFLIFINFSYSNENLKNDFYQNQSNEIKKIIALTPAIAEILFDLNLSEKVIAVPEFTKIPNKYKTKIKNLGPFNHLSAEFIHTLKPDLIIASSSDNNQNLIDTLKKLKNNVLVVSTNSFSEINHSIDLILKETKSLPNSKILEFKNFLKSNNSNIKNPKKIFLQIGFEPIITVSKHSFINELINKAGLKNIYEDETVSYPRPQVEDIILKNPEIIIICPMTENDLMVEKSINFWNKVFKKNKPKIVVAKPDILTKPNFALLKGYEFLKCLN